MTALFRWPARTILSALVIGSWISAASAAGAATWSVDMAKSQLGFSGTQTGAAFDGKFTRFSAAIVFDPDHLDTSHITVTVDLASAATGDVQRDTALPGSDWFDVAEFPKASFVTTAIRKTGQNAYEAAGNLTLRGVTKPLVLPFTLQIDGTTAHAVGHVNLVRTAFGIGQGPWATGEWVALDVDVNLDITATRSN